MTYQAVFGPFFNLRTDASGNRVILAANGPLPDRAAMAERAEGLADLLAPYGVEFAPLLDMMDTTPDWDPDAAVLTDQYSPVNLLQGR